MGDDQFAIKRANPSNLTWGLTRSEETVRDGLPGHRSRLERAYIESLDGWIVLARVPGVTPVHHVDYWLWYAKQREFAALCHGTIAKVECFDSVGLRPSAAASDPSVLDAGGVAALTTCTHAYPRSCN